MNVRASASLGGREWTRLHQERLRGPGWSSVDMRATREGLDCVHPFYGPNSRFVAERGSTMTGLVTMAAYLAFWAAALATAKRELDARFPRVPPALGRGDPALEVLRLRYARGEVDRDAFLRMREDLAGLRGR